MNPAGSELVGTDLVGVTVVGAAALVVAVRGAAALTEIRLRAPGWPIWRCGPAAALVVLHDLVVGAIAFAMCNGTLAWLLSGTSLTDPAADGLVAAGAHVVAALGALGLSGAVLRRRRGTSLASLTRPRGRVVEPVPPLRSRLLTAVERAAVHGAARWITAGVGRCMQRSGTTAEQLLPALWPAARLRLREAPGVPRTEVALLLLQAQAVMDDASPARERMLTLLHLVHERAGCRGVRGAIEQARRSPVRHGRSGAAPWAASPGAVPVPVQMPGPMSVPMPVPPPSTAPGSTPSTTPSPTPVAAP